MPIGTRHHRDSGKTVIDALAACAALTLLGCMILPALSKERDDARIAECADHLKQLGQAAHQYAADFEGKFFYHWTSEIGPDGKLVSPELIGSWHDQKRVGRYLDGQPMAIYYPAEAERPPKDVDLGLGWGVFRCPSDLLDGARSYGMNYWAITTLDPGGAERRLRETFAKAQELGAGFQGWHPPGEGDRVDAFSKRADRTLLFSDAFGTIRFREDAWVTGGTIGKPSMYPGERFGGSRTEGFPGAVAGDQCLARYRAFLLPTQFDYVRHGVNQNRNLPVGAINITFVDGHVSFVQSSELYDPDTKLSTYRVLWSGNDKLIESLDMQ